jgi:hypothetical protein
MNTWVTPPGPPAWPLNSVTFEQLRHAPGAVNSWSVKYSNLQLAQTLQIAALTRARDPGSEQGGCYDVASQEYACLAPCMFALTSSRTSSAMSENRRSTDKVRQDPFADWQALQGLSACGGCVNTSSLYSNLVFSFHTTCLPVQPRHPHEPHVPLCCVLHPRLLCDAWYPTRSPPYSTLRPLDPAFPLPRVRSSHAIMPSSSPET